MQILTMRMMKAKLVRPLRAFLSSVYEWVLSVVCVIEQQHMGHSGLHLNEHGPDICGPQLQ